MSLVPPGVHAADPGPKEDPLAWVRALARVSIEEAVASLQGLPWTAETRDKIAVAVNRVNESVNAMLALDDRGKRIRVSAEITMELPTDKEIDAALPLRYLQPRRRGRRRAVKVRMAMRFKVPASFVVRLWIHERDGGIPNLRGPARH